MTDEQALHLAALYRELLTLNDHVRVSIEHDAVYFTCISRYCSHTESGPEEVVEEYDLLWHMDTRPSVAELTHVCETWMA
jgi:hypothetical protein